MAGQESGSNITVCGRMRAITVQQVRVEPTCDAVYGCDVDDTLHHCQRHLTTAPHSRWHLRS